MNSPERLGEDIMKYALLTLMALLVCTAGATNAADTSTDATPTPTSAGGKGGGQFREKLLEKFDTNHDGKLDDTEKAAMKEALKAKILAKFDTNHDGKLDDTEKAAMKAAIQQRRAQHGGGQGQGRRAGGGRFGGGTAQKTSSTDSTQAIDPDTVQKLMDQVDAKPSVKF